jgi:hypothetical protein
VICNIQTNLNGTIFNRKRQYITYADDTLILGWSVTVIEEIVTQIKEDAVSTGLVINEGKTKYVQENKQQYNKFTAKSHKEQTSI